MAATAYRIDEIATAIVEAESREQLFVALEGLRPKALGMIGHEFGGAFSSRCGEDLFHDALARTMTRYDADEDAIQREKLVGYVLTATRHLAINEYWRKANQVNVALEAAENRASNGLGDPEEYALSRESAAVVRDVVGSLPVRQREVVARRFGQGYDVRELPALMPGLTFRMARKDVTKSVKRIKQAINLVEQGGWCRSRENLFDGFVAGTASEDECRQIELHVAHCHACADYVRALQGHLHEMGTAAVVSSGMLDRIAGDHVGLLERASATLAHAREALSGVFGRAHSEAAAQIAVSPKGGLGPAITKLAAICGVGAVGAATCAATGVIGPGIGLGDHPDPAPKLQHVADQTLATDVNQQVAAAITTPAATGTSQGGGSSNGSGSPQAASGSDQASAPVAGSTSSAFSPTPTAAPSPSSSDSPGGGSGGGGGGSIDSAFEPH
jgi:DNA-directed RNA polymerase specialized sigma24 family protein